MTIFIIMVAYMLGIIWGLYIKNIVPLILLIITIILIKKVRKLKNLNRYIKILIPNRKLILILIIFILSFTYISLLERSFETKYENIQGEVKVQAIVISNINKKEYKDTCTIKVKNINGNKKYNGTVLLLSIKNNKKKLEYGDKITFIGQYKKPTSQRNNGGFDYKQYLKTKKIYGIIETNKIEKIEKFEYNKLLIFINKINSKITNNANQILTKEQANLFTGILIGNKEKLTNEIEENFRNSNLSHMLAVSGTHVAYVILGITFILKIIKTNKRFSKIITIILLILFIFLTGGTASVTRACVMAIYIIARKFSI